ncbi:hypothetical protein C8J57DRAFT_1481090 [Mycena rebaudengoi]|nr:hypothetical protein C8J57DRAFT_1481090 [Mycena rebaudengoi]
MEERAMRGGRACVGRKERGIDGRKKKGVKAYAHAQADVTRGGGYGDDEREEGRGKTDGEDHGKMEGGSERMERGQKMGKYGTRGDRSKKDRTGARGGNGGEGQGRGAKERGGGRGEGVSGRGRGTAQEEGRVGNGWMGSGVGRKESKRVYLGRKMKRGKIDIEKEEQRGGREGRVNAARCGVDGKGKEASVRWKRDTTRVAGCSIGLGKDADPDDTVG